MGTVLDSETRAYEPLALKLYTLAMIALCQSRALAKLFLFPMEFEASQLEQKLRGCDSSCIERLLPVPAAEFAFV